MATSRLAGPLSVRHRGLLALSLVLLAGAGGLAALLDHDGIDALPADIAHPGDHARMRGELVHVRLDWPSTAPYALRAALRNDTYLFVPAEPVRGVTLLVTSEHALPTHVTVIVSGKVAWAGQDPASSDRMLHLVTDAEVDAPILFR